MKYEQLDPMADDFARLAEDAGILPIGAEVIIDGPRVKKSDVDEAAYATYRLLIALHDIFKQRYGGSLEAFGHALGHTSHDLEVYLWDQGTFTPEVFTRADTVLTDEGFKFVEFNVGSSVGGMVNSSLAYLLGFPQQDVPLQAWAQHVAKRIPSGSLGILVEDEGPLDKMRRDLNVMAQQLEQAAGVTAIVCSQKELSWDGEQLCIGGRKIDWVYPLFFPNNVAADPESYSALRAALCENRVFMPITRRANIFGSKMALAMLHDIAATESVDSPFRQLVERWVAWTTRLDEGRLSFAIEHQQYLVLKPVLGLGGKGVVIGRETDPDSWRQALTGALVQQQEMFILQHFYPPAVETVTTSHSQHGRRSYEARCVWGIYTLDGHSGGTPFMRSSPVLRTAVINYATGGSVGALPMR
ncbi:hypothetical protein QWZ03_07840 [Chitinimonas viridis]|uniref:Glutathionylspermidine synthase family protein n=1 Tax=Chitinimonas viridis TaxID=664880 RepID=A0ABT8B4U7_9NEIS|nr:hypothetical protein [Chitinimonas viridis]MDN3576671.1 hypothetical protein [Chitinimonas viridis]